MSNHLVEVNNINKTFGRKKVLDNVSFFIDNNEIVGFIGPNGAGKSTTMKCIASLIFPDQGSVTVSGYDVKRQRELALSQMASLIESPGLYLDISGRENIKLFASLRNIKEERIKEIYDFTGLKEDLDRNVNGYSMGMKQRLALGIALLSKPKFLILDEPTNGLDPTGVIQLRNTLLELVKNEDISILFSSHQLGEVEKLADRLICINQGKIIETPMNILEKQKYLIKVDDMEKAVELLNNELKELSFEKLGKDTLVFDLVEEELISKILKVILDYGINIIDITKEKQDIEVVYKEIYKS
ncbi:MAG: ABC transporter ATP-binding protein [Clostridium sulfidigenes]|uniref:ABC transporter ATP-binding protein n=1 Tax=Clostridium sulfidigenes TaxID=318464 RepID=A0A927W9G4_9CLOT|nr:ABC transporter ATP-binding protein [Clostridium sulfidigenes]